LRHACPSAHSPQEEVKEFAFSDIVDEDTEEAFENYLR